MEEIKDLWLKFNEYSNKLAEALGRTSNLVGEYAEYLVHQYYGGRLLRISNSSADIETEEGKLYQVKSRKIKGTLTTQLSIIRSWKFDYLVVVLFDEHGVIKKALEVPVEVAKEYAAANSHQNGGVITTTQKFLNDQRSKDISVHLSSLNCEQYAPMTISKAIIKPRLVSGFTSQNNEDGNLLPIQLTPSDPDEFKTLLLISRLAEIQTTYSDGRVQSKRWNASQFKQSSNVLGNLRSRPEYRAGNWQANHIVRVDVEVIKNA
jgi:hypothetical protein